MSRVPSPFKFLDSYQQSDVKVFFGRSKETTELYNALSGVKHLMVYGPSGSGKTSLVECGLRNRFSNADWYALTIRKGTNINASIYTAINAALSEKIPMEDSSGLPSDPSIGIGEAVKKLFKERFQPVYLLFDQFEELLISGDPNEQRTFFEGINKLIHDTVPCRIMLIMREEFIGHLSEFEALCPTILQNRYRVERMGRTQVQEVIHSMLEAPQYRKHFDVSESSKLAEKILEKLPDKRKEIELSHVQVFLGELWDRANLVKTEGELPVFSADLIKKNDNLESVLESFLKKQLKELEDTFGEGVPLELLATMISEKFTKLQRSETDIIAELESKQIFSERPINELLKNLESRRIIRALKAGDETQYEIGHDTLALVVGQNLTDEMKMREKAMDVYNTYAEQQGLFSQEVIDRLRSFSQYMAYPPELKSRIETSSKAIREEKQKEIKQEIDSKNKKKKMRIMAGALVILIAFTVLVIHLAIKAQQQRIIADNKKVEALKAEARTKELLKLVMQGRGEQYEDKGDEIIIEELRRAQTYPIDSLIKPKGSLSARNKNSRNRNYTMWIDVPSFRKHEIKEVQYKLCPGFGDRVRISDEPSSSFSIGYLGYGYCPSGYDIYIILKRGDTIHRKIYIDEFIREDDQG